MSKMRKALLVMLVLALTRRPLDMLLAAVLPAAAVDPAPGCIGSMLMCMLLLGVPALLLRPWTSPRLVKNGSLGSGIVLGVAGAMAIRMGFETLDAQWQCWLGIVPDVMPVPQGLPMTLLYIVTLALVPALVEEMFFRGALLTGLLDGSRRPAAIVLTTLFFALMHGDAAHLPSHLAVALMLTLLMLHTGRIAVPAVAHFFYNIAGLFWVTLPDWTCILGCTGAAWLFGLLLARQPKIAHPPMKRLDGLIAATALMALAAMYFV